MEKKSFTIKEVAAMRRLSMSIVPLILLFWIMSVRADTGCISHTLQFSFADLMFDRCEGYDVVRMKGANGATDPGNPDLSRFLIYALIPHGAEIESAELVDINERELSGRFHIAPAQAACPLSSPDPLRRAAPNPAVYASSSFYPATAAEISTTGSACGFRIAGIAVSPVRYLPSEGKLVVMTKATLKLRYRENVHSRTTISRRQYDATAPVVRSLVFNGADLKRFAPPVRPDAITDVNYAIVTDDAFKDSFDSFKLWKTKKGFRTEVFATSWIYSNYTGYDNPEKVRNFLKDYHAKKGLVYVLLAGDCDKVPHRLAMTNLKPGDVASDYYFCDLDGTWDTNNDHRYGEARQDTIDGYFDIYAGRLPSDNTEQIGSFVHKDTIMEKRPFLAGLKKLLLPSTMLWNPKHGKDVNKVIADTSSAGWQDIELVDPPRTAIRDSFNAGVYLTHIAMHGNPQGFLNKDDVYFLHVDDIGSLTSTNNAFSILYSIACNAGKFDSASGDCIAEQLVNRRGGGCVAAVLNSRFGYGAAAAGYYSGSEQLSFQFTTQFFKRDTFAIGQTIAATKHVYREDAWKPMPNMTTHNAVNGWTLFGDPDLPLYEELPTALSATYSPSIDGGQQNFTVTVGAPPVAGALVCCYKEGEVHATGYTDASGKAALAINPKTSGRMYVTATAKDRLPFEGVCNIGTTAAEWNGTEAYGATGIMAIRPDHSGGLTIRYRLAKPSHVHAVLYDSRGAVVETIVARGAAPGINTLVYRGRGSGVYLIRLSAGGSHITETAVIAK